MAPRRTCCRWWSYPSSTWPCASSSTGSWWEITTSAPDTWKAAKTPALYVNGQFYPWPEIHAQRNLEIRKLAKQEAAIIRKTSLEALWFVFVQRKKKKKIRYAGRKFSLLLSKQNLKQNKAVEIIVFSGLVVWYCCPEVVQQKSALLKHLNKVYTAATTAAMAAITIAW